jgi:cellobiose phosphorylase
MALNTQIFHPHKNKPPEKRYEIQRQNNEKRHTLILIGKESQPNQVKAFIILISTSTNNHKHNAKSRSKKNRECLRQLYGAIIPV